MARPPLERIKFRQQQLSQYIPQSMNHTAGVRAVLSSLAVLEGQIEQAFDTAEDATQMHKSVNEGLVEYLFRTLAGICVLEKHDLRRQLVAVLDAATGRVSQSRIGTIGFRNVDAPLAWGCKLTLFQILDRICCTFWESGCQIQMPKLAYRAFENTEVIRLDSLTSDGQSSAETILSVPYGSLDEILRRRVLSIEVKLFSSRMDGNRRQESFLTLVNALHVAGIALPGISLDKSLSSVGSVLGSVEVCLIPDWCQNLDGVQSDQKKAALDMTPVLDVWAVVQ